ncbi:NAD(P)-binding protein [Calocera cornea HHB12733]|uniref:NAD(P)-binding protein n=1 Tax=Calocera cornea HHB12733 TaxID=1353952 RepID=A0A165ED92_9BASI|nr:NAD(P)-binding protein [Calocera cornea HHB12733]
MANLLSKRYPLSSLPDLSGKVAVVTGGSAGLGKYIAMGLALANAKVLIAAPKDEYGDQAAEEINKAVQEERKHGRAFFLPVDLGCLSEVKSLAERINREERLDLCFWNAGIGIAPYGLTKDGLANHFQINHLSHFYLTDKLLPLLRKTVEREDVKPGAVRIVSTASENHRMARSDVKFENLEEVNGDGDPNRLYSRSKLMNILFTKELVRRVLAPEGNKIMALAVHPGVVHTDQQKGAEEAYGPLGTVLRGAAALFFKSPDVGAESSLWAATAPEVCEGGTESEFQGAYVTEPYGKTGTETDQAKDEALANKLWVLSEKTLKDKGYPVEM